MNIIWSILSGFQGIRVARQVCSKVALAVLPKVIGSGWDAILRERPNAAFDRVFREWREQVSSSTSHKTVAAAFEEFFCRKTTTDELRKLFTDDYEHVDFDLLTLELKSACEWARCPIPSADIRTELVVWVSELEQELRNTPNCRQQLQQLAGPLMRAMDFLRAPLEVQLRNVSLARYSYLSGLVKQHRYIRFAGMAEVAGPQEVPTTSIFVMPRLIAKEEDWRETAASTPVPASKIISPALHGRRIVILGGPGTGKSTLLQSLALAFAQEEASSFDLLGDFDGTRQLPVFYRIRDLERDLNDSPTATLWDCIHVHSSKRLGVALPKGFFHNEMKTRGLLLLFDGLDEARSSASRNLMVDLISAFCRTIEQNSSVVITTRPHEYAHRRFESSVYAHYELCSFNAEEIHKFIECWQGLHEPSRVEAAEKAQRLWQAINSRPAIRALASNPLLLTMTVRVHFGLGTLPDSRVDLYGKCAETLLKHWIVAKDLPIGPMDLYLKYKFLGQLAYSMQNSEKGPGQSGIALHLSRFQLARHLEDFLVTNVGREFTVYIDSIIELLHSRDAILVDFGSDQFGFLHRSFQEYFAAWWMAQQFDESAIIAAIRNRGPEWKETLCLTVALLNERTRERVLVDCLSACRIEFAVSCLQAAARPELWLGRLISFLAKYYQHDVPYAGVSAEECASLCATRAEVSGVVASLLERENRDGRAVAAALELGEALIKAGVSFLEVVVSEFLRGASERSGNTDALCDIGSAWVGSHLITNEEFEAMVPGHRALRDEHSNADDDPVIHVCHAEATLYCRWLGEAFRLPTELEWEYAASFDPLTGCWRVYPWGDEFDSTRCNTILSQKGRTTPVGAYPNGRSALGCYDMAGNVWEWTSSVFSEKNASPVIKGGSWKFEADLASCRARDAVNSNLRSICIGFRVARPKVHELNHREL